jgi:hypothetical protein
VREIRMLRAMWRVLETGLRKLLTGHEGGNAGYRQGASFGSPRQRSTLPGCLWSAHWSNTRGHHAFSAIDSRGPRRAGGRDRLHRAVRAAPHPNEKALRSSPLHTVHPFRRNRPSLSGTVRGRIKRASTRSEFMKQTGYPKGRKGYVVDHIVPLECGGVDPPSKDQDFSSSAKMSRARSICSFDSGLLGASLRKSRNSRAAPARSPCCRKASPRL